MTFAPNLTTASAPLAYRGVYLLALGAFIIGTEGFMIAGVLPEIARDTGVSVAVAGQLVTVFASAYAISSPVLTTVVANWNRHRLLVGALAMFVVANVLASRASGFAQLLVARVVLAIAAGLYMPNANALASAIAGPERRGRALATVHGGVTAAVAVGAPMGTWIANVYGWRATFASVAASGLLVVASLLAFGRTDGTLALPQVAGLGERLKVLRDRRVVLAVVATTAWAAGIWVIYPYLAVLLTTSLGFKDGGVARTLGLYGGCAMVGVTVAGRAIDRLGSKRVLFASITVLGCCFAALSLIVHILTPSAAVALVLCTIALWGAFGFMFNPAQQANLLRLGGPKAGAVVLALNGSFLYLGFSLGAALGSLVLTYRNITEVGWFGAACEVLAAVLLAFSMRGRAVVASQI